MNTLRFILLLIAAILTFLAAVGVASWGIGSVTFHTFPMGMFFFIVACLPDASFRRA